MHTALCQIIVTLFLDIKSQALITRGDHPSITKDMHHVRAGNTPKAGDSG